MRNYYWSLPRKIKLQGGAMIGFTALVCAVQLAFLGAGWQYECHWTDLIVKCRRQHRYLLGHIPGRSETFRLKDVISQSGSSTLLLCNGKPCDDLDLRRCQTQPWRCREGDYDFCNAELVTSKEIFVEGTLTTESYPISIACGNTAEFNALLDNPNAEARSFWIGQTSEQIRFQVLLMIPTVGWLLICVYGYGIFWFQPEEP